MVLYRRHATRWDESELDNIDEATWERMRQSDQDTQRIMQPLAADFFQRWDEEEEGYAQLSPKERIASTIEEFRNSLWRVIADTATSIAYSDVSFVTEPARLGSQALPTRIAETIVDCPALADVPGIEPAITLNLRRQDNNISIRFDLRGQRTEETPPTLSVGIELTRQATGRAARRREERYGTRVIETIERVLTLDEPWTTVELEAVSRDEEWRLDMLRLEPFEEGDVEDASL